MTVKFKNRILLVSSMHAKERAIAPVLEPALGVTCFTDTTFNTDRFGTFTGEITRTASPLDTVRIKCREGMQQAGCDLAIATEATFGPHPGLWMIPAHHEIMMLIDERHGLEIHVSTISTDTNYASSSASSEEELLAFARKAGFPAHGLILQSSTPGKKEIAKGITHQEELLTVYRNMMHAHGDVRVETDMRAHLNPKRMSVIRDLTGKLLIKINQECPACHAPGFGVDQLIAGLPCRDCGMPTRSAISKMTTCACCGHTVEQKYPANKMTEEPGYCPACNP